MLCFGSDYHPMSWGSWKRLASRYTYYLVLLLVLVELIEKSNKKEIPGWHLGAWLQDPLLQDGAETMWDASY